MSRELWPTKCRRFSKLCATISISLTTVSFVPRIRIITERAKRCGRRWKKRDLYLDRYEGWYSVRDEAYYEESELVLEDGERRSPNGTPVEWTAEESWFFRLSNYQQPLLDHYASNPEFIRPESRRNEVVRFVDPD